MGAEPEAVLSRNTPATAAWLTRVPRFVCRRLDALAYLIRSGLIREAVGLSKLKLVGVGVLRIFLPHRIEPVFRFRFRQGTFELSWCELGVFREVFLSHHYSQVPGFQVGPDWTILDIGANVGLYSVYAAKQDRPCTIYAVEPSPQTVPRLRRNLARNHVDGVRVFEKALWSDNGTILFETCKYSVLARVSEKGSGVPVQAVTLDAFVQEHGISRIDLLKLDAEFAEEQIIRGGQGLALSRIHRIVMEYHTEAAHTVVEEMLCASGFRKVFDHDRALYFVR